MAVALNDPKLGNTCDYLLKNGFTEKAGFLTILIEGSSGNETIDVLSFSDSKPGDTRALVNYNDPVNFGGGMATEGEMTVGTISTSSDLELTSVDFTFALDDGTEQGSFSGSILGCYCDGLVDLIPDKKKKGGKGGKGAK